MRVFELILSCYGSDSNLCISTDMKDIERAYDEHHESFECLPKKAHETVKHGWVIYVWEGGESSDSRQYEDRHELVEHAASGGDG